MAANVIIRVHAIAKNTPDDLTFGDRDNNPIPNITLPSPTGPYESDNDSAYIPNDDDDTAFSNSGSDDSRFSGPNDADNASDITGVSESNDGENENEE